MMDPTTARLRTCFSRVFPNLTDEEILEARVEGIPEWDSLATVTLVSLVEEEFGVSVDLDDLEELMSFQKLLKHIQNSAIGA
jgi:acyl carrier protein